MNALLAILLKVSAWVALVGATAVFLFSVASARVSIVLGAAAFVMGFLLFLILLALGLLLDHARRNTRRAAAAPGSSWAEDQTAQADTTRADVP